jgi:hypothetical protein
MHIAPVIVSELSALPNVGIFLGPNTHSVARSIVLLLVMRERNADDGLSVELRQVFVSILIWFPIVHSCHGERSILGAEISKGRLLAPKLLVRCNAED